MEEEKSIDRLRITKNIKNIIFDLDGTLYPIWMLKTNLFFTSLKNIKRSKTFYRARTIMRSISWDDAHYISRSKFLSRQANTVGVTVDYFNGYYEDMKKRFVKLKCFDGVKDTLIQLREKGFKLFVFSDFPIENKLKEMKLVDYFDAAFCSEDTGFLKPDPRGFEYLKELTGIQNNDTMMVGDMDDKDGLFAKNCSIPYAKIGKEWKWVND